MIILFCIDSIIVHGFPGEAPSGWHSPWQVSIRTGSPLKSIFIFFKLFFVGAGLDAAHGGPLCCHKRIIFIIPLPVKILGPFFRISAIIQFSIINRVNQW